MAHFESNLNSQWNHTQSPIIIATELAFANGNIGEALLTPQIMERNKLLLDRLQAIGVKGVVLAVKYPLLDASFPRSAEYLQFFKTIVEEAHKRGIKVLTECGVIFAGTPYSPLQMDWSKYTSESLMKGMQDQLILTAREVKPDYLLMANEPTTEEMLTGLKFTPEAWSTFLTSTAARIDRSSGILVGAGVGTWEDPSYFNQVMQVEGLDFIDLHIYPMGRDAVLLDRALSYAQQARSAGNRVTISEASLYKAAPQEMGKSAYTSYAEIYDRDVYSFWSPLDERFTQDIINLADATQMDFISFFWTRYFFAYLDYDTTPHNQSTQEINRQINQATSKAVQDGSLSTLGQWFQETLHTR